MCVALNMLDMQYALFLYSIRLTLITNCHVDNKKRVTLIHCPAKKENHSLLCAWQMYERMLIDMCVRCLFIIIYGLIRHTLDTTQWPDHRPSTGKVYCQQRRGAECVQVCGTGVLKRVHLSPNSAEDHNFLL